MEPVPSQTRKVFAFPVRAIRLNVRDLQGNPIAGASAIAIVNQGDILDVHDFEAIPKLNMNVSDSRGELLIDFSAVFRDTAIHLSHPSFAVHHFKIESVPIGNSKFEAEVVLVPGTPVTVSLKDLRKQENGSPIAIKFGDRFFELDHAQDIVVPIDFRNINTPTCDILSGNSEDQASVRPLTIQPSSKQVSITVFPTRFVQGFAREPKTKVPLSHRSVLVMPREDPSVITLAETQHDGYFRIRVPNLGGEISIQLSSADSIQPDYQGIMDPSLDSGVMEISGKASSKKRIQVLSNDSTAVPNVVIERGEMFDSRWDIAFDGWIEAEVSERTLLGFEAFSMNSKKSASVLAGSANVRSLTMRDELNLVGGVVNSQRLPAAWEYMTLRTVENIPSNTITKSCKSSSMGRIVLSGLLPDKRYEFKASNSLGLLRIEIQTENLKTPDFVVDVRDVNVPALSFNVDTWIHGPRVNPNQRSNRPILVVTHCASGPFDRIPIVDRLHCLRSVYSEEDLDIVLIYLLEPYDLLSIQSELKVRDCRFSVGIDRTCKTRETLPSGPTLFLPEANEVFCLSNLAFHPIRDILLYLRSNDSK